MKNYSLTHLSDELLRKELSQKAASENEATAELLAHVAEFDERKLYLPAAYPSMLAYCVGELGLSEEEAKKRIRVARVGRACPRVFEALADGRVHLSGLVVLAAHLKPETAEELIARSARKTREEIERLLAERFPKTAMPASVTAITWEPQLSERSPGTVAGPQVVANPMSEGSPGTIRPRVAPFSAEHFAVQFTRNREADERFRYLQDLLGHQVARGDLAEVYDRAVKRRPTTCGCVAAATTNTPPNRRSGPSSCGRSAKRQGPRQRGSGRSGRRRTPTVGPSARSRPRNRGCVRTSWR